MRIRAVRKAELETLVAELWAPLAAEMAERSAFDELVADAQDLTLAYKRDRFAGEAVRTLVAADGDRLVGYVTAEIVSSPPIFTRDAELRVEELYVREGERRRADLVSAIEGPVNVLAFGPDGPSPADLEALGVARVSTGAGPMHMALEYVRQFGEQLLERGEFAGATGNRLSRWDFEEWFAASVD